MMKKSLVVLGASLALNATAQASNTASVTDPSGDKAAAAAESTAKPDQDPPGNSSPKPAPVSAWTAQGQLGLVAARGNTTTTSGNAQFNAAHEMGLWTIGGGLAALYASTRGITTQEDLNLNLQGERDIGGRAFWFGTGLYDRNLFSGFDYTKSIASGVGYHFLKSSATLLSAELGLGYRIQQPIVITLTAAGGISRNPPVMPEAVQREAVLYAGLNYEHSITRSTKLLNSLLVESGSSDTMASDNFSLQVKIDGSLSLALGVQLINNTNPPPGDASHTDTVMTVNLVYQSVSKTVKLSAVPQEMDSMNLP